MYQFTEQHIFVFLIQIFLLLGLARILGEIFRRWKQPALTAEILAGILLGPTILGRLCPAVHNFIFPDQMSQQSMLETVMWLGLLFFLLETGLKMDFSSAWRHRGNAFKIAVTDIVVPMTIGFFCSLLLPSRYLAGADQRLIFAFFMATAMTISAMPITIRVLTDLNLIKTDLGYLIMSALSVNEIIGWIIFTLILGTFTRVNAAISKILFSLFLIIGVACLCLTAGKRLADFTIRKIKDNNIPEPGASLTFLCLLGCLCGAIFQKTGIHALLGFFIAGIMAGEAKELPERTRQVISQMVYAIFVPLFFTGIGLRIDFFKNFNVFLVLFVTLIGIGGKFIGAWIGTYAARLSPINRLPIAIAHIPGGSMEIVMGIIALRYGFITEPVFVAIVFGAVFSAVILGPWLKFSVEKRKEVSILEFFSKNEIVADLRADNRDTAILELCGVACATQGLPHIDTLYAAVLQRENMMGTAVEEGVALPHARFDIMIKPLVVFARSDSGLEWNSPDGKPTHFIFLILTPKGNEEAQLQILRIISKTMQQEKNRTRIMQAKERAAIWEIFQEIFVQQNILKK